MIELLVKLPHFALKEHLVMCRMIQISKEGCHMDDQTSSTKSHALVVRSNIGSQN